MGNMVQRVMLLRRRVRVCALLLTLGVGACASEQPVSPSVPVQTPASRFVPLAFSANVNVRNGRVTITAPKAIGGAGPTLALGGSDAPSLSLLGGEAVRLVPSNYTALPVGTFAPNKVRVTFDVTIENKLPSVALTTPTWPQPPAAGVIMFPLDYMVGRAPGDTTGDGNSLLVAPPRAGMVVPSADWNGTGAVGSGAPFSFFNDVGCSGVTTNECVRWVAYDTNIQPTSFSSTHTVGFDIDATVDIFSARMIVAGDLVTVTPLVPSMVVGLVTSTQGMSLPGVRATVTTGQSATTSATGVFVISGLTPGDLTVALSNLPSGCTSPTPRTVTLAAGDSAIADFLVTCAVETGLLTGTLTSADGGAAIAGAMVVASTGGSAVTNASGVYLIPAAGAGSGTLTVSRLLATCSVPPAPFVLQLGGAATVDLVATCAAPTDSGN